MVGGQGQGGPWPLWPPLGPPLLLQQVSDQKGEKSTLDLKLIHSKYKTGPPVASQNGTIQKSNK